MPKTVSPVSVKKSNLVVPLVGVAVVLSLTFFAYTKWQSMPVATQPAEQSSSVETVRIAPPISLPKPTLVGKMSVEATMQNRRSRRDFTSDSLNLKQVGQMLWAAQGVTSDWGGRTAPSAKSAYPLTVYLVSNRVVDLDPGVYEYLPGERESMHQIQLIKEGDVSELAGSTIVQNAAKNPPAIMIIAGDMDIMAKAFDNKRNDYNVYLEAGHAAQNAYLQAESLGLGMVTMAGFDKDKVAAALNIPGRNTIIYAIPFGIPKP